MTEWVPDLRDLTVPRREKPWLRGLGTFHVGGRESGELERVGWGSGGGKCHCIMDLLD